MEFPRFGQEMKKQRKKLGITQKELGEKINRTESSIRKYEKGLVQIPLEVINEIGIELGIPVYELILSEKDDSSEILFDDYEGIEALLGDMYGRIIYKTVHGEYGFANYYVIGENENKFVLYDDDIRDLIQLAEEAIKPIVERIKDDRDEKKIIDELLYDIKKKEESNDTLYSTTKNNLKIDESENIMDMLALVSEKSLTANEIEVLIEKLEEIID